MTAALLAQACSCAHTGRDRSISRSDAPVVHPAAAAPESRAKPPASLTSARGMWVWSTKSRLGDPTGIDTLLGSCRRAGLNEVYLSVGAGALDDPRLPAFIGALQTAHVRVEALMGEAAWYRPENRGAMFATIEAVARYNRSSSHAAFAGIHLDVEPHQLPENRNNHVFLPALAEALAEATTLAAKNDLTSSADLPRFALDEDGPAFARAVDRPFVMLYQLRDRSPTWLTKVSGSVVDHTFKGLAAGEAGRIVIGLRVDDYPEDLETMVGTLDHEERARYGGWAIHDEAKYRARTHP